MTMTTMIPLRSVMTMMILLPREVPVVDTARNRPNIRKSENESMMNLQNMTATAAVTTIVDGGITNGTRNHPKRSTKSGAKGMTMKQETIVMAVIIGFPNSLIKDRTDER